MSVAPSPERLNGLVAPGTWQVDASHSSVEFQVKHLMISKVKGRFTEFAGTLEAGEDGTVKATGTIQAASVDTHENQRDEHLRSGDFFDAATHPEIAFASTAVTATGGKSVSVAGDLTIRGTTRPVVLNGSVEPGAGLDPWGNERVALELRGQISRSDFGLTWNQVLETGGVVVGDAIKLELDLALVKPAA